MSIRFALGLPQRIGSGDFEDFCSIFPRRPKMSVFGGCKLLDNTPSIASTILDDADDAMHAGDAKQGAENCRKRKGNAGMQA